MDDRLHGVNIGVVSKGAECVAKKLLAAVIAVLLRRLTTETMAASRPDN